MSDDHARAIERAQKLLRLAAPGSGTTEAERANAAIEAAKIIAEHGLGVAVPPPPVKKRRGRPPAPQPSPQHHRPAPEYRRWSPPSQSNWTETDVPVYCACVACGQVISAGEAGWFDPAHGYRHYDITCTE
jgi:hypothetical protein